MGTPAFSAKVPYRIKPRTETIRTKYGYRRYIARNGLGEPVVGLVSQRDPRAAPNIKAGDNFIEWIDRDWVFHSAEIEVKP